MHIYIYIYIYIINNEIIKFENRTMYGLKEIKTKCIFSEVEGYK